jgi:hypothetical protein
MTSARRINAQHPKNVWAIGQTTKRRPNSPEEARKMV